MEQRNFDLLYLLNTCRDVDLSYLDLIISFTPVTNVHSHFLDFVSFIDLTIRQVADESTDMVWPRSDCNALNHLIKPICKSLSLFRNVFFFEKYLPKRRCLLHKGNRVWSFADPFWHILKHLPHQHHWFL